MAEQAYTSEDFESVAKLGFEGCGTRQDEVIFAALRIAAAVMRPGVIEVAVTRRLNDESSPTDDDLSEAIRLALLQDTRNE